MMKRKDSGRRLQLLGTVTSKTQAVLPPGTPELINQSLAYGG